MSETFSLCCPEKKLKVWIGQGVDFKSSPYKVLTTFYSGEKDTMDKLHRFLQETYGSKLELRGDDGDYEENCIEFV